MARIVRSNAVRKDGSFIGNNYPELQVDRAGNINQTIMLQEGMRHASFPSSSQNAVPTGLARERLVGNDGVKLGGANDPIRIMSENVKAALQNASTHPKFNDDVNWYNTAHEASRSLAKKYGHGNHMAAAGVIAAVSGGNTDWKVNLDVADRVMEAHRRGGLINPAQFHNTDGLRLHKALRILDGEHPDQVLGAAKEGSFFRNIYDPTGEYSRAAGGDHMGDITLDTWQGNIQKGWKTTWEAGHKDLRVPEVYELGKRLVHHAALDFGLRGHEGQAGMWEGIKRVAGGISGAPQPESGNLGELYPESELGKKYSEFADRRRANNAKREASKAAKAAEFEIGRSN